MGKPRMCPKCKFKGDAYHELFKDVKRGQLCNDCNKNFRKCGRCAYIGSCTDEEFIKADGDYGLVCIECRKVKRDDDRKYKKRKFEEDPIGYRNHLNKLSNNLYKKSMKNDEYREKRQAYTKKWRLQHPEYKSTDNYIISKYERRAKENNIEMSISNDEIIDLTKGGHTCHYCNEIDIRGYCGIDRVDPNIGYVLDNCVSSCSMCNYMKYTLQFEYFISYCGHIGMNNNLCEAPLIYERMENWTGGSYDTYKNRALKNNKEFSLSKKVFCDLKNENCYICGRKNSSVHTNGIDRVDNNKGYTIENSKACCGRCNYMKKKYTLEDFLEKCVLIYENWKKYIELYVDEDDLHEDDLHEDDLHEDDLHEDELHEDELHVDYDEFQKLHADAEELHVDELEELHVDELEELHTDDDLQENNVKII